MKYIHEIQNLLQFCESCYLWTVCLNCVVNVDEDQENCYQKSHPPGNYLWIDQETENIRKILGLMLFYLIQKSFSIKYKHQVEVSSRV